MMTIKDIKRLSVIFFERLNKIFNWYIAFIFFYGILTVVVFIPVFGALSFHVFTAITALSFGTFLCSLSIAQLVILIPEIKTNSYNKKKASRKKKYFFNPIMILKIVLIFILLLGGGGGLKAEFPLLKMKFYFRKINITSKCGALVPYF
jgi:uncharacterized membrane protein